MSVTPTGLDRPVAPVRAVLPRHHRSSPPHVHHDRNSRCRRNRDRALVAWPACAPGRRDIARARRRRASDSGRHRPRDAGRRTPRRRRRADDRRLPTPCAASTPPSRVCRPARRPETAVSMPRTVSAIACRPAPAASGSAHKHHGYDGAQNRLRVGIDARAGLVAGRRSGGRATVRGRHGRGADLSGALQRRSSLVAGECGTARRNGSVQASRFPDIRHGG